MASIRIRNLKKSFDSSRKVLDDISLDIQPGEMVALIGASGSGKSTLLRHISGLLLSDCGNGSGCVEVGGSVVQQHGIPSRNVRGLRADIGFVFQQFNLVDRLPVLTNVLTGRLHAIPLWRRLAGHFRPDEIALGLEALNRVGIADQAWKRASALSGGQQQRAAIARALVQGARAILADEPIASLDPESARRVMEILRDINRTDGCTVVVSLHQIDYALRFCPRTVALNAGRVIYDGPSAGLTPALVNDIYGGALGDMSGVGQHATGRDEGPVPFPLFNDRPERSFAAAQA